MSVNALDVNSILVSGFLLWGVVEDLRLRKVRNFVVIAVAALSFIAYIISASFGFVSIWSGLTSLGTAVVIAMPFAMLRILGAGDVKLLAACSFIMTSLGVFETFVYSFIWGSLLGIFQIAMKGELNVLFLNLSTIAKKATGGNTAPVGLHQIPYTVALFMGWLTYLSLNRLGVSIL